LRQRLVELADERAASVTELGKRRAEEAARGRERAAAVERHLRRTEDTQDALAAVGRAREQLREVAVSSYMSAASPSTDVIASVVGVGDVNDSLSRRTYGASGVEARTADLRAREREHRAATGAQEQARVDRVAAEQAEQAAIDDRRSTEHHIEAIDAETLDTRAREAEAVLDVDRKQAAVLVALADLVPARLRADVVGDGIDFQLVALDAWVKAAAAAPCRIEWWALAGISKIEGRHGRYGGGQLSARGYPTVPIIGPALTGFGGFAHIADSDDGHYDGDPTFDRAVGPMQFIPSTWARWGRDGDGDGEIDPHDFYDAAAAAAAYLCSGRTDLTADDQLRAGLFSYNHSAFYVSVVLAAAREYQQALPSFTQGVSERGR
jgi:membrane-bound lytic murein transglycosylase B